MAHLLNCFLQQNLHLMLSLVIAQIFRFFFYYLQNMYTLKLLNKIKIWLKDYGYFILDTTNKPITEAGFFEKEDYNNNVVRYRRKWKKEDLELFMQNQGFFIQDSVVYKDTTSNKEWLIYSFRIV